MRKNRKRKGVFGIAPIELPIAEREKIEIVRDGNDRKIVLNGVKRILQYDPLCMIFSLGKERLEIRGTGLDCVFYISGAIGIRGKIQSVVFAMREEKG